MDSIFSPPQHDAGFSVSKIRGQVPLVGPRHSSPRSHRRLPPLVPPSPARRSPVTTTTPTRPTRTTSTTDRLTCPRSLTNGTERPPAFAGGRLCLSPPGDWQAGLPAGGRGDRTPDARIDRAAPVTADAFVSTHLSELGSRNLCFRRMDEAGAPQR